MKVERKHHDYILSAIGKMKRQWELEKIKQISDNAGRRTIYAAAYVKITTHE